MMLPNCRRLFSPPKAAWGIAIVAALVGGDRVGTAQVVQLPSTQTFGYSGGAIVPDSGQAHLGGMSRQRTGSATRGGGLGAGRAVSGQTGGASVSVSASIIDLQAMDAAILNAPAASATNPAPNYSSRFAGTPIMNTLTPHLYNQRMGADQLVAPGDPNGWQIALAGGSAPKLGGASAMLRDDSEVRYYMLRAQEANNAGRTAAALVYYRLAHERLTPAQRARLQELQAAANADAREQKKGLAGAASQPAAAAGSVTADGATTADDAPAASAAGSAVGEAAPAGDASANPFDTPF